MPRKDIILGSLGIQIDLIFVTFVHTNVRFVFSTNTHIYYIHTYISINIKVSERKVFVVGLI